MIDEKERHWKLLQANRKAEKVDKFNGIFF